MITLYTFGPFFGCPDASPFVMKGEMLLKLSRLPYQCNTRGFTRAPKGKLPYIDDGGTIVADSTLIRLHLERQYAIDFDRGLSARDRGIAWSVEKMLEDHLYWLMVYWRWMIDANFNAGPKGFFRRAPAFIRPLIEMMVRRRVRANLHGHGIGRHLDAEKAALASRCIDALAQVMGSNRYLMGDEPCGADATMFAFIAAACAKVFESPLRDKIMVTPELVAYHDRMMGEFFPAFASGGAGSRTAG
jgi:glutathione S-transferase